MQLQLIQAHKKPLAFLIKIIHDIHVYEGDLFSYCRMSPLLRDDQVQATVAAMIYCY